LFETSQQPHPGTKRCRRGPSTPTTTTGSMDSGPAPRGASRN